MKTVFMARKVGRALRDKNVRVGRGRALRLIRENKLRGVVCGRRFKWTSVTDKYR